MCADARALVTGVRTDTGTTTESALLTRDPRGKLFQDLQPFWGQIFLSWSQRETPLRGPAFRWQPAGRRVVQELCGLPCGVAPNGGAKKDRAGGHDLRRIIGAESFALRAPVVNGEA